MNTQPAMTPKEMHLHSLSAVNCSAYRRLTEEERNAVEGALDALRDRIGYAPVDEDEREDIVAEALAVYVLAVRP